MFREAKTLAPDENTVTVVSGLSGTYPNIFFSVDHYNLGKFVDQTLALSSKEDYRELVNNYGIRRTNPQFWQHSDLIHNSFKTENPIEYGILDYSRLENR